MRVSDEMAEMVERMCHAYNDAVPQHDSAQLDGMRAALEYVLGERPVVEIKRSAQGPFVPFTPLPKGYASKRVALVPVDD